MNSFFFLSLGPEIGGLLPLGGRGFCVSVCASCVCELSCTVDRGNVFVKRYVFMIYLM